MSARSRAYPWFGPRRKPEPQTAAPVNWDIIALPYDSPAAMAMIAAIEWLRDGGYRKNEARGPR